MRNVYLVHYENIRKKLVRLIFIIYWLLIFEGALRKWAFPWAQRIIFFIRDPFTLMVYWTALKYNLWPKKNIFLNTGIFLGIVSLGMIFVHILTGRFILILAIYGWRNYFFYLPLAFIIAKVFTLEDVYKLIRETLLIAIPIAVLVYFQFSSPPDSVINKGFGKSPEESFSTVGVGRFVRTFGTFTSSAGQTIFVGSLVAMVLSIWIMPPEKRLFRGYTLWIVSFAVLTNLALSGSRGAFVITAIVLFVSLSTGFILSRTSTSKTNISDRALAIPIALGLIGAIILPYFFTAAITALLARAKGAAIGDAWYSFGIVNRALKDFIHFIYVIPKTPLLGFGMGSGGNARGVFGIVLPYKVEDDWSRNIVDLGPLFGTAYILMRIMFVFYLIRRAILATKLSNNPLPLLLLSFIGIILLYGQLTGQGTINGYGWIFAGMCMATSNSLIKEYFTTYTSYSDSRSF